MNFANKITTLRILLTPFFISLILYGKFNLALIVFIIAVISDAVDGYLARKHNQWTKLGSMIDPIADKIVIISAFVCLTFVKDLPFKVKFPPYIPIIVISRDIIILLGAILIYIMKGSLEVKPTISGKVTTFFQMLTVIFVLMQLGYSKIVWNITAALTVISGIEYVVKGSKALNGKTE